MKRRRALLKGLTYLFLIVSSFIVVYPVLYLALAHSRRPSDFSIPSFFPSPIRSISTSSSLS